MKVFPTITGALCANSHPGSYTGQDAFNNVLPVMERNRNEMALCRERSASSDVNADGYKHPGLYARSANHFEGGGTALDGNQRKYVLRRLTPTECARLQGFPDWWCDGADGSDSAMYKMWGNGIALPCAADVLGRIAKELERMKSNEQTQETDP